MYYAEAASPRITETSICAAQQLFNSSCWAVSRFSSGGILASAASKVPPTDCLGAKILPQNPQNSQKLLLGMFSHRFHGSAQIVWVRRFSHRFHGIHRNSCWGYSPTDFTDLHRLFGCEDSPTESTEFTETLAGDILPQISQIYTDCLGVFKGVHLSQVHQPSYVGAPLAMLVHLRQVHPLKLAASV